MRRIVCSVVVVVVAALGCASAAAAAGSVFLCVPSQAGKPVTSGGSTGRCGSGGSRVALPSSAAQQRTLLAILPHLQLSTHGVGGKPTIRFTGVNVQLVDGTGKTTVSNGLGNLVIGYDSQPGKQTGSHNLIVGDDQTFTSYGGVLGGFNNRVTAPDGVAFGVGNSVSRQWSSVLGGYGNTASGRNSVVAGGEVNMASGEGSSIAGGDQNKAPMIYAAILGGLGNKADGAGSTISGGSGNTDTGYASSILGGSGITGNGSGTQSLSPQSSCSANPYGFFPDCLQ